MLLLPQASQCSAGGISCHSGGCSCPKLRTSSLLKPISPFPAYYGLSLLSVALQHAPVPTGKEKFSNSSGTACSFQSNSLGCSLASWRRMGCWQQNGSDCFIIYIFLHNSPVGQQGSGEIFIDTRNVTRVLILHPLKIITGKSWLQNAIRG